MARKATTFFCAPLKSRLPPNSTLTIIIITALLTAFLVRFSQSNLPSTTTISTTNPNTVSAAAASRPSSSSSTTTTSIEQPRVCLVYDRPPRTGSSTAGVNLQQCWESKGFNVINNPRLPTFEETFDRMLDAGDPFVAAASNHIYFERPALLKLYEGCQSVFYMTSTRDMRGRIISAALGSVEKHNFTLAENVTMTDADISIASKIIRERHSGLEVRMERYPFKTGSGQKMVPPDYVIRHQNFEQDLNLLLRAFGCDGPIQSVNVHVTGEKQEAEEEEEEENSEESGGDMANTLLRTVDFKLKYNDARHKKMSEFAEKVNDKGLRRAAELAQIRSAAQLGGVVNWLTSLVSSKR